MTDIRLSTLTPSKAHKITSPLTQLISGTTMVRLRGKTSQTQLSNDEWQIRVHETLSKDQFTEDVLIH